MPGRGRGDFLPFPPGRAVCMHMTQDGLGGLSISPLRSKHRPSHEVPFQKIVPGRMCNRVDLCHDVLLYCSGNRGSSTGCKQCPYRAFWWQWHTGPPLAAGPGGQSTASPPPLFLYAHRFLSRHRQAWASCRHHRRGRTMFPARQKDSFVKAHEPCPNLPGTTRVRASHVLRGQ